MTLVANNRNRNFTDELDQMPNQVNENMDDSGLELVDEKRTRKAVFRRTIDYNSSVTLQQEQRLLRRKYSNRNALQPDIQYQHLLTPPQDYKDNPMNCVCVKHVRTSTNKNKCPIYSVCWTPDGRRLITAASSGEFTLWNGLTFNFETILQAHDTYIKAMKWSHNEEWLLSGDDLGMVKYWQANMNDVNVFQAHKDAIRGLSFCPSDKKFVTCSVDNTVRIWDFQMCKEERVLRGHGGEVKCVAWHPTKALVLSGSKDSQQPLKLWDPKAGECISTMYVHKSSCNDIAINKNGNWFLSASKDHTIKLFDLRNLKSEMQVFRGHKKDVFRVAWNPFHENLFASGSGDGALMYWLAGTDMEVGSVDDAHDNIIWSIDWHPMGHILATGSNDFATKFWTRNRPGDVLKDNQQVDHNMPSVKIADHSHCTDSAELDKIIKRVKKENALEELDLQRLSSSIEADLDKCDKFISDIPGLSEGMMRDMDLDTCDSDSEDRDSRMRGTTYRVIPKQFVLNWADKKKHPAAYISKEPNQPMVPPPIVVVPEPVEIQAVPVALVPLPPPQAPVKRDPSSPMIFLERGPNTGPGHHRGGGNSGGSGGGRDHPKNFPTLPERRPSPGFIMDPPPLRFQKMEKMEPLEPMSVTNHNGQNNYGRLPPPRGFRHNEPYNRRLRDFTEDVDDDDMEIDMDVEMEMEMGGHVGGGVDGRDGREGRGHSEHDDMFTEDHHDDDFRDHYDRDRPRFPIHGPRRPPRNIHPSNPDFLFERAPQRPHQRHFRPNNPDFGFSHPGPRMFPQEHRFDIPHRQFGGPNHEPPFMAGGPRQRGPSSQQRHFRPQPPPGHNLYEPLHPPQRLPPPVRHFPPSQSEGPFHPPGPRLPPPPRNFHPGGFEARQPLHRLPLPRPAGPTNVATNKSENPFEPNKSTGSSKTFIPLPFNNDESSKRTRPNMAPRQGLNW